MHMAYKKYHSVKTVLAMFQCNTLCRYTTCGLCTPLAKGYVHPVHVPEPIKHIQYTIYGCLEPNIRNCSSRDRYCWESSPTIHVEASTIPHAGQDGNHQLCYYYFILG